jgi:hypothetical protein
MQNIKKYFMTLALLLTAVGGAWAQDTYNVTFKANGNTKTVENVTLPKTFQCSYNNADGDLDLILKELYGWTGDSSETICANWSTPKSSDANKVVAGKNGNDHYITIDNVFEGTVTITGDYIVDLELTQYSLEISIAEPTEWSLTPDETGKTWTLDKMPASNIELQVEYFAESNLFLSKDALADKANIAVKAGDLGVQFGDDGKSANTITEGTPMTVTYNGTKKVIGFKAAKKAPTEGHALSASAVGEIVGTDGKAYAVEDKDDLPSGVTAVAMVAYKSGSNGLAIQLNGNPDSKNWADAKTYPEGLTAVSGGTWRLPSKADWQNMFVGCAVSGDATVPNGNDEMNPIAGFKAKIAAAGITWQSDDYWTSTEGDSMAWMVGVNLDDSNAKASFGQIPSDFASLYVRACLAF